MSASDKAFAIAIAKAIPKGDKGDKGDPGDISEINGKSGSSVTLDAGDLEYDDSETYASGSIGEAVSDLESDVSDVKSQITNVQFDYLVPFTLESGTFADADGKTKNTNNKRIRNASPIDVTVINDIIAPSGYEIWLFALDSSMAKLGQYSTNWINKISKTVLTFMYPSVAYINMAIRKTDSPNADISSYVSTVQAGMKYESPAYSEYSDIDYLMSAVNGINITFALDKSDTGNATNSYHTIRGYFYKNAEISVSNTNPDDYNIAVYLYDANGTKIQTETSVPHGQTKTIIPVKDAVLMRLFTGKFPMYGTVTMKPVTQITTMLEGFHGIGNDIVDCNSDVPFKLASAQKLNWSDTIVPLTLLHFSDPHGGETNVKRILDFHSTVSSYVDDIICTGDIVSNKYSDSISYWTGIDGIEDVLVCIGNHDVTDGNDYDSYSGCTPEQAYTRYMAPYISGWGVEHTGSLTYYYKDYSAKKIRLIVMDYLLSGDAATAQNTWLQSVLADALTNDLTVVIAEHCPVSGTQYLSCNFTMIDKDRVYTNVSADYQASVASFKTGGGKFACWLVGHSHCDMIVYNSSYPDQICVTVTCATAAQTDNDQIRNTANRSRDAFNMVTIDTNSETIKIVRVGANIDCYLRPRNEITISYADKTIISQS